jgi:hypothetical protein
MTLCRICNLSGNLLHPCKCHNPFIHRECLDTVRHNSVYSSSLTSCDACGTEYEYDIKTELKLTSTLHFITLIAINIILLIAFALPSLYINYLLVNVIYNFGDTYMEYLVFYSLVLFGLAIEIIIIFLLHTLIAHVCNFKPYWFNLVSTNNIGLSFEGYDEHFVGVIFCFAIFTIYFITIFISYILYHVAILHYKNTYKNCFYNVYYIKSLNEYDIIV